MIAIKHSSASNIHIPTNNGAAVNDPLHTVNIFNDYFSSITEKTMSILKFRINHPDEEILSKKLNIIIVCIYRHPKMNLDKFNSNYLNVLLQKNSKEKKNDFLPGNFNEDLSKYDKHAGIN